MSAAASELDKRRAEVITRLRSARATVSPRAAVAATEQEAGSKTAAQLDSAIRFTDSMRTGPQGFQPRSVLMKLLLERPELTLKVVATVVTLVMGARASQNFGSIARFVHALRQVLSSARTDSR